MYLCIYASIYLCIYVCADFILNAFGAKRQALARTSWRFQRPRYYEKHPRIIVRDCPLSQSLTIKMSDFSLLWFLQMKLTISSLAVRTPTTNSDLASKHSKAPRLSIEVKGWWGTLLDLAPNRKNLRAGRGLRPNAKWKKACLNYYQGPQAYPTHDKIAHSFVL